VKAGAHLLANLVAASADRRPDGHHEVGRPAAELPRQLFDRHHWNRQRQASPARVRRGHGAGPSIGEKQRQAISRLDGESQIIGVRHNDVRLGARRTAVRWRIALAVDERRRAVHLAGAAQV